ncbi:GGDEF domain-containing protein [Priestia megaterium]|uniref:sensor domain-containing protein n=1 Tax=Priestia megaterium TaxID=1404 RepID=UPI000BEDE1E6|nr:bifunctional diguanylate cyclase/phosphodiesterase [Priestia megaterium]PEC45850.1 GGDEF domain-containing protein [Priestia megaterium]
MQDKRELKKQPIDKQIIKHFDGMNTQFLKEYNEGIFFIDCVGNVIFSNKAALRLIGNDYKEKSQQLTEFIHEAKQEEVRIYFQRALKGEKVQFGTTIYHKTKNEMHLCITLLPSIVDDQVLGVYAVCRDYSKEQEQFAQLSKLETHLKMEQKLANIGSWCYDVMEDESYWSHQLYKIYGVKHDQRFVPSFKEGARFIHPRDRKRLEDAVGHSLATGESYKIEYTIIRPNGEKRMVFEQADAVVDEKRKVVQLLGVVHDITESKVITNELKQKEHQFQTIYNNLDAGIWSVDVTRNKVILCSDAVLNIYGENSAKFLENRHLWEAFVYPEDRRTITKEYIKLMQGKSIRPHYRIQTKKGEIKWVRDHCIPTCDEQGNLIRIDGIIEDITEEKRYVDKIEYLATHDYLTNLPNRIKFEREVKKSISKMKENDGSLAVFHFGLDRFKHINDTLGHDIGDQLLMNIAKRLKERLEPTAILARVGEDEFAVCSTSLEQIGECKKIAAILFKEIEKEIMIDDFSLYVTASMGISIYPHDGEDAKTLYKNANIAMHRAKELGRSDWQLYSPLMDSAAYKSYHLEKGLRNALLQDEFFIEYQPKVHAQNGEIDSLEALIRWNHPEWGRVSPGDFIPLAEETNLIIDLGDWVLEHVCKQLQRWKKQGKKVVPVSVNVPSKRLLKRDFVEYVEKTLAKYEIQPSFIEFEITESSIIQHEEHVKKVMEELKKIGVTFALDDFGTGFSSLSHLKDLEFNVLKIDKTFIQNVGDKGKHQAITKSLLYLAHALDMKVIAEGVETTEQLDFLLQHDCPFIQGFIFSKPVGKEKIEEYLRVRFL